MLLHDDGALEIQAEVISGSLVFTTHDRRDIALHPRSQIVIPASQMPRACIALGTTESRILSTLYERREEIISQGVQRWFQRRWIGVELRLD